MFTLILELCHFDLLCWLRYSSSSAPSALLSWWSLRTGSSLALLAGDGHFPSTPVAGPTLPILQGQVGLAFYLLFSSEWLVFHRYRALLLSGFTLDHQNPFLVPVKPKEQSWRENQELEQIIFIRNVLSKMKNTFLRSLKISEKGRFTNSVMEWHQSRFCVNFPTCPASNSLPPKAHSLPFPLSKAVALRVCTWHLRPAGRWLLPSVPWV